MRKRSYLLFAITLIFLLTACYQSNHKELSNEIPASSDAVASFHFIDVGQGDCTLITDGITNILIDAGTYESGSDVCHYLEKLGIKEIDFFIGTHPHDDHLGGASSLLKLFEVKKVYMNQDTSNAYFYEKLLDVLIKKSITPVSPQPRKTYKEGEFEIQFLSPDVDFGDTNDNSLVTMVTYKNIKALFMGDAERKVESYLTEHNYSLSADILKIGHHGSRNATSNEFLYNVNPRVAVIQCGEGNSYGHPHEETLHRIKNRQIPLLRTDTKGTIVLRTDGDKLYSATEEIELKEDNVSSSEPSPASPFEVSEGYIGNANSKVFHMSSCPNLPSQNNRINFSNRTDATDSGYKPCGNCNP